jgi:hypothetical protein
VGSLLVSLWAVVASGAWTPLLPPCAVIFTWKERGETRWELWRLDDPQPVAAEGVADTEVKAVAQMHHARVAMRCMGAPIVVRMKPEVACA